MLRDLAILLATAAALAAAGCVSPSAFHPLSPTPQAADGTKPGQAEKAEADTNLADGKAPSRPKGAKTLFEWAIGPKSENGEAKDTDADGTENEKKGTGNGNGKDQGGKAAKSKEEEKPLDTDRPDFGAATTTVGKGRAILETGYSIYRDRTPDARLTGHSYPDAVLRVGLFADWFEFRIGQSFASFTTTPTNGGGAPVTQDGAQDLYLGTKLALTAQKNYLPETVIIIQSTVPSGSKSLTAGQVLPGIIYLYSWDMLEDRLSFSGLIEADRAVDVAAHPYLQMAQTLEVKYAWTPKFKTFLEWVALYPMGAVAAGVGPQYYIHPGTTYYVTKNFQLDAHVFIGLNQHATDFFGGPGLSIRY